MSYDFIFFRDHSVNRLFHWSCFFFGFHTIAIKIRYKTCCFHSAIWQNSIKFWKILLQNTNFWTNESHPIFICIFSGTISFYWLNTFSKPRIRNITMKLKRSTKSIKPGNSFEIFYTRCSLIKQTTNTHYREKRFPMFAR